jgi:8-oxo-dGTP diphosphatase
METMSEPTKPESGLVRVGVGLIRRGNRFLIGRRPERTVYAGYWEFPGGKCEPDESPEQATARECLEETGLEVIVGKLRKVLTHKYPHGTVELYFFDCETRESRAEPRTELGMRWVQANEFANYRFPEANDSVQEELTREYG